MNRLMNRLKFEAIKKVYDIHFLISLNYAYEVLNEVNGARLQYDMTSAIIDLRNSNEIAISNFFIYGLHVDIGKRDIMFNIDIDFIDGTRETIPLSILESLQYGKL